jgi:uncharacterized protein (DUF983 family)
MKCPMCGDGRMQRRIGRLWNQPWVIYHCEACDRLYAEEEDKDKDDERPVGEGDTSSPS